MLGNKPEDIAEFFHADERLDKTVIGDFLGENERYMSENLVHLIQCFCVIQT